MRGRRRGYGKGVGHGKKKEGKGSSERNPKYGAGLKKSQGWVLTKNIVVNIWGRKAKFLWVSGLGTNKCEPVALSLNSRKNGRHYKKRERQFGGPKKAQMSRASRRSEL